MADKLDGGAIVANTIPGTKIQSGTITTTQLAPAIASAVTVPLHPKISSISYPGDDLAANTGGGDSIVIRGSGFGTNVQVYINGTAAPSVTRNNANAVTITTAAQSPGTYLLYLINTDDGGTAILIPGIQYSGTPTWVTTSPLDQQQALSAWSISLSATGDSPITYALQAGSSLPAGITLAANGLISGTMTSPPESDTTYNFTVLAIDPQLQDTPKAFSVSVTVIVDPQFQYTTLLLQADGTNNGNNHAFLDSSNNNFTITRNGNATQGSFTPFSPTGWSMYQSDINGAYISFTTSVGTAFQFTGDFTVECWVYPVSYSGTGDTSAWVTYDGSTYFALNYDASGNYNIYLNSGSPTSTFSSGIALNQWNHIAMVRSGSTVTLYTNGTARGTISNSSTLGHANPSVARNGGGAASNVRYMSNLRIVKGTAVYTSNFTPSTAPLTAIANTQLLTVQSNRWKDNSNNNFTPTVTGTPSVQTFSPFAASSAYSPATHGGSAYFDGSGDYLTTNATQAIPATGDFTIEAWVYSNVNGPGRTIVSQGTSGSSGRLQLNVHTDNTLQFGITSSFVYSTGTVNPYSWNYVAVTRTGSSVTFYINGINAGSATLSGSVQNTALWIGSEWTGDPYRWSGYISSVRISNIVRSISAVTSPFSSDANTVFLCNFTNAQIYDAAAGVVGETVGAAKVNTAIKQFGAGSIDLYNNNNTDYLYLKSANAADLGGGDFTVEFWMYPQTLSTSYSQDSYACILDADSAAGTGTSWWVVHQQNQTIYWATNGGETSRQTGNVITAANTWYHVAISRASGVVRTFVNGNLANTVSYSTAIGAQNRNLYIGKQPTTSRYFKGYLDDIRISKGLARYRYNFTPPTRAFATKGGTETLTADEYFDYTTLLLPGNGTNNQNNHTFLDSSTNNFAITRNGNATQGTFSPFSQTGWSNYFDGTGDYLNAGSGTNNVALSGDFCIEAWIYRNANADGTIIGNYNSSPNRGWSFRSYSSNNLYMYFQIDGGSEIIYTTSSATLPLQQWTHVVWCRSGTNTSVYINGSRVDNRSLSGTSTGNGGLSISALSQSRGDINFNGYISNARVVNGSSVYDPSQVLITVPTTPLTAITNTSLLTCQSNRFVDNSNNAFAITRNGDVSVQAFSPFAPTASYAAANVGGGVYFDGSGDYLSIGDNAALDMGSSDFTIEGWYYPLGSASSSTALFSKRANSGTVGGVLLYYGGNGLTPSLLVDIGGNWAINTSSAVSFIANQWNHFAVVRNGSAFNLYINGVSGVSATNAGTIPDNSAAFAIGAMGADGSGPISACYMAGFRVAKGTAVYTGAFTPPAAPPTNIANTSLLTNFTNAGITDATAKNIFETVGDAKISTVQSKFGGSSMYFDGTGDYCLSRVSQNFAFGTGDFTVECWIRTNTATQSLFGTLQGTGSYGLVFSVSVLYWQNSTMVSNLMNATATPILDNNWHHVAVSRYNGTSRMFFDGVQVTSASDSTDYTATTGMSIGYNHSSTGPFNGYINDLRITKGIARYTQNFTPPTTAFLTK